MELSHAQLLGFRTKFETTFNQAFELAQPQIEKIALKVDSGRNELVNHRWMRGLPGMREFKDARVHNNISTDGFVVKNKLWEDTLAIDRVDIERDQFGVYTPMMARMGEVAKLHRDSIGFGLLSSMLSDTSIVAYDAIAFYGAHTSNRASTAQFTNKVTTHLSESSLSTGITELRKRKDSAGNPLAAITKKPLLIIPPDLELVAQKLLNQSYFPTTQPNSGASSATSQAASGENVLKGSFEYVVSPYLATTTEWHLTLVDNYFKPIVWQIEQDIEFLGYDKFLHEWSNNDKFVNGVRALYNVAPGLPEMCYGSTGAA
jgi:phage major head subunit gpT-like protein